MTDTIDFFKLNLDTAVDW